MTFGRPEQNAAQIPGAVADLLLASLPVVRAARELIAAIEKPPELATSLEKDPELIWR
ncbi:hypothetical protein [Nocardia sp. MW-W600-9]